MLQLFKSTTITRGIAIQVLASVIMGIITIVPTMREELITIFGKEYGVILFMVFTMLNSTIIIYQRAITTKPLKEL